MSQSKFRQNSRNSQKRTKDITCVDPVFISLILYGIAMFTRTLLPFNTFNCNVFELGLMSRTCKKEGERPYKVEWKVSNLNHNSFSNRSSLLWIDIWRMQIPPRFTPVVWSLNPHWKSTLQKIATVYYTIIGYHIELWHIGEIGIKLIPLSLYNTINPIV